MRSVAGGPRHPLRIWLRQEKVLRAAKQVRQPSKRDRYSGRGSRRAADMSEHDSDIEFDFFDELETGESPPPTGRARSQRPPGEPPKRPPEHRGIPPTARLAGLIAFGILIVVLLVLWVQSCSSTSKK